MNVPFGSTQGGIRSMHLNPTYMSWVDNSCVPVSHELGINWLCEIKLLLDASVLQPSLIEHYL